jgi:hypothetical protein
MQFVIFCYYILDGPKLKVLNVPKCEILDFLDSRDFAQ